MNNSKYLNLGCGNRFLEEWINVDYLSYNKSVISCNLLKKFPFEDKSFDVVYTSHVLEHFSYKDAILFLLECHRVLNENGILRIVVPDMELIVRSYLKSLDEVLILPNQENEFKYKYDQIDLLDQLTRTYSGGMLGELWRGEKEYLNEKYLIQKAGLEYIEYRQNVKKEKRKTLKNQIKKTVNDFLSFSLKKIIGEYNAKIWEEVKFRKTGEVHRWMYDRYSLGEILKKTGFVEIKQMDPFESQINNWKEFQYLDVENGKIRKPDSLIMEAIKS